LAAEEHDTIGEMTKEKLIRSLIKSGYLKTPAIIKAFKEIDRKDFVPEEIRNIAYANQALPIGHEQTISQPLTVAFMLELLQAKPGDKILDIGGGSGWQAAILAHIVGKRGKVITAERIPELVTFAKKNLAKYALTNVKAMKKDASIGYRTMAPYDKIIAAAATHEIPDRWKEQLKVGGSLIAPVNHSIIHLQKKSAKEFVKQEFFGFSFVPLIKN
jgi:protein-L-isoaspartate(D-aspartate) O-methyltransferase